MINKDLSKIDIKTKNYKKTLLKLSLLCFGIAAIFYAYVYFFFYAECDMDYIGPFLIFYFCIFCGIFLGIGALFTKKVG